MSTSRHGGILTAIIAVFVASACLVFGAEAAAVVAGGHHTLPFSLAAVAAWRSLFQANAPLLGWPLQLRPDLPANVAMYWVFPLLFAVASTALYVHHRRAVAGRAGAAVVGGEMTKRQLSDAMGVGAALARAPYTRPSLGPNPSPDQVSVLLGRTVEKPRGVEIRASVEDSIIVLGPSRSGKTRGVLVPTLTRWPGPAVTTSTRREVYAAASSIRSGLGPTLIFDPSGDPSAGQLRWSPVAGCEQPRVAIRRARVLVETASGFGSVSNSDFWSGSAQSLVRCLLHAAALAEQPISTVTRWLANPADPTPANVLRSNADAAPGWLEDLEGLVKTDVRQRDGIWAGARLAFSWGADPVILQALSPPLEDRFDPAQFLVDNGTLFLVGTSSEQAGLSPVLSCLVDEIVAAASALTAAAGQQRLDPPCLLALDEVANIAPLPSLPSLISEGGGSGIATLAIFQGLSQAQQRWHDAGARAIWEAASTRLLLPGISSTEDLRRVSELSGEVDEEQKSLTSHATGESTTISAHRRAAWSPDRLRRLPEGHAAVLSRGHRLVEVQLCPIDSRKNRWAAA